MTFALFILFKYFAFGPPTILVKLELAAMPFVYLRKKLFFFRTEQAISSRRKLNWLLYYCHTLISKTEREIHFKAHKYKPTHRLHPVTGFSVTKDKKTEKPKLTS